VAAILGVFMLARAEATVVASFHFPSTNRASFMALLSIQTA